MGHTLIRLHACIKSALLTPIVLLSSIILCGTQSGKREAADNIRTLHNTVHCTPDEKRLYASSSAHDLHVTHDQFTGCTHTQALYIPSYSPKIRCKHIVTPTVPINSSCWQLSKQPRDVSTVYNDNHSVMSGCGVRSCSCRWRLYACGILLPGVHD